MDDAVQALDQVLFVLLVQLDQVFDRVGEIDQNAFDVRQEVEQRLRVGLELADDRHQNVHQGPLVPALHQLALILEIGSHEVDENLQLESERRRPSRNSAFALIRHQMPVSTERKEKTGASQRAVYDDEHFKRRPEWPENRSTS